MLTSCNAHLYIRAHAHTHVHGSLTSVGVAQWQPHFLSHLRSSPPRSMPSFEVEAVVRGYHVYKEIWNPYIGEELFCARELTNLHDPFAIAVVKSDQTVGHVPLKISLLCSMLLRHGGTIICRITGRRQYTRDLVQGGLEISCTLKIEECLKDITKVERLIRKSLATFTQEKEPPLQNIPVKVNLLERRQDELIKM